MSERYTSPDLSRRLRDAGLEQDVTPAAPHYHDAMGRIPAEDNVCADEECWQFRNCCRAPRLDEVLEELRQEINGVELVTDVIVDIRSFRPADQRVRVLASGGLCRGIAEANAAAEVEGAGLVLLALLEARKGGGA